MFRSALLSLLSFTQKITTSQSSLAKPSSNLAYYAPPSYAKPSFIIKNLSNIIITLKPYYCLSDASLLHVISKKVSMGFFFLPKDTLKTI